jgi:hypothetical protein
VASGLNLLVSAIILWNTKYLEVAYTELRRQGRTIKDDLLRHVAPLGPPRPTTVGPLTGTEGSNLPPSAGESGRAKAPLGWRWRNPTDGHRWDSLPKIRFAPDSPLEGVVSSELVSANSLLYRENTGNFIGFGLRHLNLTLTPKMLL